MSDKAIMTGGLYAGMDYETYRKAVLAQPIGVALNSGVGDKPIEVETAGIKPHICRHCKFYSPNTRAYNHDTGKYEAGECNMINDEGRDAQIAYLDDGQLICWPDFGCVLWEAKDE